MSAARSYPPGPTHTVVIRATRERGVLTGERRDCGDMVQLADGGRRTVARGGYIESCDPPGGWPTAWLRAAEARAAAAEAA